MKELTLGPARTARIWIDEPPPYGALEILATKILEAPATPTAQTTPRFAAIEWLRFTGLSFHYAMLGANFIPAPTTMLRVIVPTATTRGPDITTSLLGNLPGEHIRPGLPTEFLPAITAALHAQEPPAPPLPAGTLTLTHAAYSDIASNVSAFQQTMVYLVALSKRIEAPLSMTLSGLCLRNNNSDAALATASPLTWLKLMHGKKYVVRSPS